MEPTEDQKKAAAEKLAHEKKIREARELVARADKIAAEEKAKAEISKTNVNTEEAMENMLKIQAAHRRKTPYEKELEAARKGSKAATDAQRRRRAAGQPA